MSTPRDFAFSPHGWAYDIGKEDRVPYRVIRIRKDGPADSKKASLTLGIEFESRDEQEWSKMALDTTDVCQNDLVIVVGELLPEVPTIPKAWERLSGLQDFDYAKSINFVKTAERTGIIVKQLDHKNCNLNLLHNKQDGLYRIAPIPRNPGDRVVYYSEWTRNISETQAGKRKCAYHANICDYSKRYVREHKDELLGVHPSPTTKNEEEEEEEDDDLQQN
ncbi:hypothetical protein EDB81DRAFT_852290 [Dactylonectria macrodidyma]|uniref:Uncharacterized protein n=1 Tax=Dactylonectria macrodidyma TaxID=307937 RepID=A0A9P9FMQ1_9HYPO|nr:hypothetical protein EDB81DRAFT_852290 [Dactylonectria macrodidyma]